MGSDGFRKMIEDPTLPVTGMMHGEAFPEVVELNRRLTRAVTRAGYGHHDILYALLFITYDFLPAPRLTPLGLLDARSSGVLLPSDSSARRSVRPAGSRQVRSRAGGVRRRRQRRLRSLPRSTARARPEHPLREPPGSW